LHEAVAWKSTPPVSIIHVPEADAAPTATHTWPALALKVAAGAWNLSAAVEPVSVEGAGKIGPVQATPLGAGATAPWAGAVGERSLLKCAKYARSAGYVVAAPFALMVTIGFENAMFVPSVGEQNAM